jgi:hypothetical protein
MIFFIIKINLPEIVAYLPKFIGYVLKIRPPGAKTSGLISNSKVGPHEDSLEGLQAVLSGIAIFLSGKVTVKFLLFRICRFKYSPSTSLIIAFGTLFKGITRIISPTSL